MGRKKKRRDEAMVKMAIITSLVNLITALVELLIKLLSK